MPLWMKMMTIEQCSHLTEHHEVVARSQEPELARPDYQFAAGIEVYQCFDSQSFSCGVIHQLPAAVILLSPKAQTVRPGIR